MPTNPTSDEYIDLLPSNLCATIFVEMIIIEKTSGISNVSANTACGVICNTYNGFSYLRDLARFNNTQTIKSLLNSKGKSAANFVPYYRNYNTNIISAATYDDVLRNRKSIIFVSTTISQGQLDFAMNHIGTHREILPSRIPN